MSKQVLTNARLFVGGVDLTGNSNTIESNFEAEAKETTNYGSAGWKEYLGGLKSAEINAAGQLDIATGGSDLSSSLGTVDSWTFSVNDTTVGNPCYLTKAEQSEFTFLGEVGEVAPWKAKGMGSWPGVRGQYAHPSGTARTATGTGSSLQLGATTALLSMYATLHVLSVSGTTPSLTVAVESDTATGFPSTANRATFTAANAAGGQATRIAGANADDWWRVTWIISGTTPSFLFVVALGLGPA